MDSIIDIQKLSKTYKDVAALRGLSLSVPAGSVCGFLGRNGAGKTTTIKILLDIARPDSGEARVFGIPCNAGRRSVEIRRRLGFVSESKDLYPYMTVEQTIRFARAFFPGWRRDVEDKLVRAFELPLERKVVKLSKGMRTKLMLALALARGAELLILDEPTEGLDPAMVEDVLQSLVGVAAEQGTTIFFSSHQLAEVEQIADRVSIIEDGRIALDDGLDDLRGNYRRIQLFFDAELPSPALEMTALEMADIQRVERNGRSLSLLVRRNAEGVLERARCLEPRSIDVRPVTLKEIFLEIVRAKS